MQIIVGSGDYDEVSSTITIDTTLATQRKSRHIRLRKRYLQQKSIYLLLVLTLLSLFVLMHYLPQQKLLQESINHDLISKLNHDLEKLINAYEDESHNSTIGLPQDSASSLESKTPLVPANMRPSTSTTKDQAKRFHNLRIAFVGDSTSRYIYLHLAFYLHRGRWFRNEETPNLADRRTLPSWNHFHQFANQLLYPNEICDCYFNETNLSQRYENRYFFDPVQNNSLIFIAKFGEHSSFGHWDPREIEPSSQRPEFRMPTTYNASYAWKYNRTTDILLHHFSRLPKSQQPNYVVLNQGLWENHTLTIYQLPDLLDALHSLNMKGIYRTTTASRKSQAPSTSHEEAYCEAMPCWNMSWTSKVSDSSMVDDLHYTSDMNRIFVEQLFELVNL